MTTHTNPEPIRLPVITPLGSPVSHVELPVALADLPARVAALERENMEDADTGDKLEARIAALDADSAWLKAHAVVRGADGRDAEPTIDPTDAPPGYYAERREGCFGCAFAVPGIEECSMGINGRSCTPGARKDGCSVIFRKKTTQPAAPDADEAAVEALKNMEVERGNGDDDGTHMEPLDLADWQINGILAAIRSGAIRLPEDAPQIAEMRARLAEAETLYVATANERDRARAGIEAANAGRVAAAEEYRRQIAEMSAEIAKAQAAMGHDADDGTWSPGTTAADALIADRDRLAAQVAELEREAEARVKGNADARRALIEAGRATEAQRDKALAEPAAERDAKERIITVAADYAEERDAARAEADALRASRDKLAGLLREAIDNIPAHEWINYTDGLSDRIDAALAEVGREGGLASSGLMDADGRSEWKPHRCPECRSLSICDVHGGGWLCENCKFGSHSIAPRTAPNPSDHRAGGSKPRSPSKPPSPAPLHHVVGQTESQETP